MSGSDQKSHGGCACGTVRFEVLGDPKWVANCHCGDCRKQTSSAFASYVGCLTDQVSFTKGKAAEHASSPGVGRGFCGTCGSPLYFRSDQWPEEIHFFLFTFDRPDDFEPGGHVMMRESVSWLHLADDKPKFQGFR